MREVRFDGCFSSCQVASLVPYLPRIYGALDSLAPWRNGRWPTRVHCLSTAEIIDGRMRGAGHGKTYHGSSEIWMNADMTDFGLLLVFIHENLHHAFPDATEKELNNRLVPWVYAAITGKKLNMRAARLAGLGPPEPGIGDRGYVP